MEPTHLLDSAERLNAFLSIAYQASLLCEEGRPVECRIALLGRQELEPGLWPASGFMPFDSRNAECSGSRRSAGWDLRPDFIDR